MNMQQVARGWFVFEMTESAVDLVWVSMSFMIPQVLFSLLGGVVADRNPKRRVMALSQLLNGLASLVMASLIIFEAVEFSHFIVFGLLNGTILALSFPARTAIVPDVVEERLVFSAFALNSTAMNIARVLGPTLAGFLIAIISGPEGDYHFGVGIVYFAISALYIVASLVSTMISVSGEVEKPSEPAHVFEDMAEVLRFVYRHPSVFALILVSIVPFLFGHSLNTLLPAFNETVLSGGADDLGILLSSMGIGAILGSLMLATASNLQRKGAWLLITIISWGILILLFGVIISEILAIVLIGFVGWISSCNRAMNRALIQSHVRPRLLGRVMSLDMMAHGLTPIGALPLGFIADWRGVPSALVASGVLMVLFIAVMYVALPAVRHITKR